MSWLGTRRWFYIDKEKVCESNEDPTIPWMEGKPYVKVYDCIFTDFPDLSHGARSLIFVLTPYVSIDGTLKKLRGKAISNKDIQKISKYSDKTVNKLLIELLDNGILSRVKSSKRWIYCANPRYLEKVGTTMSPWRKEHAKYTNSATWKAKRDLVLSRDDHKCQQCGSTDSLHVHHLTYSHFKNEPLEDLITLCKYCHSRLHNKGKEVSDG